MNQASVCLVRTNAAALGRFANPIADAFLDGLVRQCPELSRVLTWDREHRRRELVDTFASILKATSHQPSFAARLAVIAVENERRGLRRHHYERGRDLLLALLAEYNAAAWTPPVAGAWREFLELTLIHLDPPLTFEEALAA